MTPNRRRILERPESPGTPLSEREGPFVPKRPWCLPCREANGSRAWAEFFGVACEWHWGILSPEDQTAIEAAFRQHGIGLRGGHVRRVLDQIWIVRYYLRQQRPPNTVEAVWRADAADLEANDR